MNWYQENRWLGNFLIAFVLTIVITLWFLFHARNSFADASAELNQVATERSRLEHLNPFPNEDNFRKTETALENYRAELEKTKGVAKGKVKGQPEAAGQPAGPNPAKVGKPGKASVAAGKPFKPQHFNVAKRPDTAKAPPVKFQQGRHIEGSEHWQGQHYAAFRNYHAEWHDEGWWHHHYGNNITFVFGAPYFFNAGYWYPAWGYSPNAYYAYDGPIYAYNHLPPDQVIANVQSALQEQGYYHGDVDGLIGPLTRAAIADYQRDHGLYETSAIDQPTLESLGMA